MKKTFKAYAICWVIMLALFNLVVFAVQPVIPGFTVQYDIRFWLSWGLILIAFVGNLLCAKKAFEAENMQKLFYSVPLISVSYTGVILLVIVGTVCMLIPDCPAWIAGILCIAVLALNALAVTKAAAAADIVADVDQKVKEQTQFVKLATVNAQNIMNRAKNEAAKTECKKVYEALRYSDPMSNDALSVEEAKITVKMDELANAVNTEAENISEIAEEIVLLVKERNSKCKALKR